MKELRCLLFTNNEVVSAIIDRRRRVKEPMPEGTVRNVTYTHDQGVTTVIHIIDDYGADKSIKVAESEVAAALVQFCINRKVPLPAKAEKFLQVINGAATLMISMNFQQPTRGNVEKSAGGQAPRGRRMPAEGAA